MLSPFLAFLLSFLIHCRIAVCQYSSDQCSWKGSGLTHEGHTRDVEQVYLRCSQGSLEWLYPTGAIIVNLRPNMASLASASVGTRLSVCIRPSPESSGSNLYLDRSGKLRLLVREEEQGHSHVHCFGIHEGAIFVEAVPHRDISRRITAFQYELVADRPGTNSLSAPCQPCSDAQMLMAVCTSDFVAKGSILSVEQVQDEEQSAVVVSLTRVVRQKTQVFTSGGGRAKRWTGRLKMPLRCGVGPLTGGGGGDFLFMGAVRFGEAWLGCAPRYKDFLLAYSQAISNGTNPCQVDTD